MTSRARLDDVPALATEVLAGKTRGRVVIDPLNTDQCGPDARVPMYVGTTSSTVFG